MELGVPGLEVPKQPHDAAPFVRVHRERVEEQHAPVPEGSATYPEDSYLS